jgi:amino acid transporter
VGLEIANWQVPRDEPLSFTDLLLGRPLASLEDKDQRIGPAAGVPVFGLDALSSAAYGPEAALTIVIPLGLAGLNYIVPLSGIILLLLVIVYFSYRQTIAAYPNGGGSYTVAKENLGEGAGLVAGAALMTDYVLNVAVGISAGVGALVSAVPALGSHSLGLCLLILVVITLVNLRGTKEAGFVFLVPTYFFLGTLGYAIGLGIFHAVMSGGHPHPAVPLPPVKAATQAVGLWLLLKAFASGCTALTGVEAVSNGVQAFKEPVVNNARKSLTVIIGALLVLLAGIAYLVHAYGIAATDPGAPKYQSVLSLLLAAVAGRGAFYYVSMGSILLVLCLSANTSFADFPRLCQRIAQDSYFPRSFLNKGRRLVYTEGILVLAGLAALLLVVFDGVTDRLIPLFAVGAFLAFTLSQAGMVRHWWKQKVINRSAMFVNGLGALATAITICILILAKFLEGAWVVVLLVPTMVALMVAAHRHYSRVEHDTAMTAPMDLKGIQQPIVVIPVERWSKILEHTLRFALTISTDLRAVHVECGEDSDSLCRKWAEQVQAPALAEGRPEPQIDVLDSPYRFILQPIVDYLLKLETDNPDRNIAVVIPDFAEQHWYYYFLHNQRAKVLSAVLLLKGQRRIVICNVPWLLK